MKKLVIIFIALLLVLGMPAMAFAAEPVVTEPVDPATTTVVTEPVVTEPVVTEPVVTEPVVTEPVVTEPTTTPTTEPDPIVTEPDPVTMQMVIPAAVEQPVANRDDVFTYTRGVLSVAALENDFWDSTLTAEILSAEVVFTYDERDGSSPAVALTFDPVTGVVTVDLGEYVGEDTGLSRMAAVNYVLSDSAGNTSSTEINFVELGDPAPGNFDAPFAYHDSFGDPVNHTITGNVRLNDSWDSRLLSSVTSASIVSAYSYTAGSAVAVPAAWSLTFDQDGDVSVYFGDDITDSQGFVADVEYVLEDSEGQKNTGSASYTYGITKIVSGCTSTADVSWGALLEQVDPGELTSWGDIFTVGEVINTSDNSTIELLQNGSLRVNSVFEDTQQNECANIGAAYLGFGFLNSLISQDPTPDPPVVDEPTPPFVDDPTPPHEPPVVNTPTHGDPFAPTPPKIPNAGMSADASSSSSALLAILAIVLFASGGLVVAAPGKEK